MREICPILCRNNESLINTLSNIKSYRLGNYNSFIQNDTSYLNFTGLAKLGF